MHPLIKNPKNDTLEKQIEVLEQILRLNKTAWKILEIAEKNIEHPWYLGGGGIYHSVWNYYSNQLIEKNLTDYDIFYFSEENNMDWHHKTEKMFNKITKDITIDLTNIATVHEWFNKAFDRKIPPYKSIEEDINSFGNSVASVGVKLNEGKLLVYAPYGLHDIFSFEVNYMAGIFTKEEYLKKANSWKNRWPNLKINV